MSATANCHFTLSTVFIWKEEADLGADNIFVRVDVIQCVIVVLLHGAQRLLPVSSNAVQRPV